MSQDEKARAGDEPAPEPGEPSEASDARTPVPEVEVERLRAELEDARAKADDHWSRFLRTAAEIENLRRRSAQELEKANKFAVEKIAGELLDVKDSLELGLNAAAEQAEVQALREGMEATLKQLSQVFSRFGIDEIDAAGQPFDPNQHEAMTVQESAESAPDTVLMVVQKGYLLNGRLLRPARVIVSRAPG